MSKCSWNHLMSRSMADHSARCLEKNLIILRQNWAGLLFLDHCLLNCSYSSTFYNLYIHIWYHDFFADRCKIVSNEPCHNRSYSSYSSSLKFHFNAWKKRWGYLVFGKWTTSKKIEVMSWTYVFTSSRYTT